MATRVPLGSMRLLLLVLQRRVRRRCLPDRWVAYAQNDAVAFLNGFESLRRCAGVAGDARALSGVVEERGAREREGQQRKVFFS